MSDDFFKRLDSKRALRAASLEEYRASRENRFEFAKRTLSRLECLAQPYLEKLKERGVSVPIRHKENVLIFKINHVELHARIEESGLVSFRVWYFDNYCELTSTAGKEFSEDDWTDSCFHQELEHAIEMGFSVG